MLDIDWSQVVVAELNDTIRYESYSAAQLFFNQPENLHIVVFSDMPGITDFIESVEPKLYPAGTADNALYNIRFISWNDSYWIILSFPATDLPKLECLAVANGVKVIPSVPLMVGIDCEVTFPFVFKKPLIVVSGARHKLRVV